MRNIKYYYLVLILSVFFTSCEKTDNTVIDPTLTFPAITSAFVNPASINSITINTIAVAVITSDEQLSSVKATITDPTGADIMSVDLKDDGVAPDTTAGDKHFTGLINRTPDCRLVGNYRVTFLAQNMSGLSSNTLIVNFSVTNTNNHPPVISNLVAYPDSAHNGPINLGLMVTATDPDGPCDIQRVFYTGVAPDGFILNQQDLFDDGSCCNIGQFAPSGDTTANDGKYTRIFIGGTPTHGNGNYIYTIHAVDRSGDSSNVLSHTINIRP